MSCSSVRYAIPGECVKLGVGFRALEEQHGSLFSCTGGVSFFFLFSNFVFGCHKESSTIAGDHLHSQVAKKTSSQGACPSYSQECLKI